MCALPQASTSLSSCVGFDTWSLACPRLAHSQRPVYRLYHSIIFPTVSSKIFQIVYRVYSVVPKHSLNQVLVTNGCGLLDSAQVVLLHSDLGLPRVLLTPCPGLRRLHDYMDDIVSALHSMIDEILFEML